MTKKSFQGICPKCSTLIGNKSYQEGDVRCPCCGNVIAPKITKDLLNLFVAKEKQKVKKEILERIGEHLPELLENVSSSKYIKVSINLEVEHLFALERESQIKNFVEEIVLMAKNFIESHPEIENVKLEINELILLGIWIIENPKIISEKTYSAEDRYYMPGKSIGHEIATPWHLDSGANSFLTSSSEEATINAGHQFYTTARLKPKDSRHLVVIVRQFNSNPEILFFAPTRTTYC